MSQIIISDDSKGLLCQNLVAVGSIIPFDNSIQNLLKKKELPVYENLLSLSWGKFTKNTGGNVGLKQELCLWPFLFITIPRKPWITVKQISWRRCGNRVAETLLEAAI
jgi:hypothetical protein